MDHIKVGTEKGQLKVGVKRLLLTHVAEKCLDNFRTREHVTEAGDWPLNLLRISQFGSQSIKQLTCY